MNQDYDPGRMNIVCRYNLLFNAAVMVEQGMGIALCLDHLADTTEHTGLTFRPLYPAAVNRLRLAWKKIRSSPRRRIFSFGASGSGLRCRMNLIRDDSGPADQ